jgi:hypothetical protein
MEQTALEIVIEHRAELANIAERLIRDGQAESMQSPDVPMP